MEKFYRVYLEQYREEKNGILISEIISNFHPKIKYCDISIHDDIITINKDCGVSEEDVLAYIKTIKL